VLERVEGDVAWLRSDKRTFDMPVHWETAPDRQFDLREADEIHWCESERMLAARSFNRVLAVYVDADGGSDAYVFKIKGSQ